MYSPVAPWSLSQEHSYYSLALSLNLFNINYGLLLGWAWKSLYFPAICWLCPNPRFSLHVVLMFIYLHALAVLTRNIHYFSLYSLLWFSINKAMRHIILALCTNNLFCYNGEHAVRSGIAAAFLSLFPLMSGLIKSPCLFVLPILKDYC